MTTIREDLEERERQGLSYGALAQLTDIGKTTLWLWEHNQRSPNAELLFCLEYQLDLPAGYFATEWRKALEDDNGRPGKT